MFLKEDVSGWVLSIRTPLDRQTLMGKSCMRKNMQREVLCQMELSLAGTAVWFLMLE